MANLSQIYAYIQNAVNQAIHNAQGAIQTIVNNTIQNQFSTNAILSKWTNLEDFLNNNLRRGGNISRLQSGIAAFLDQGSTAGAGRALDALQGIASNAFDIDKLIHPFYLVVLPRLYERIEKKIEEELARQRQQAATEFGLSIAQNRRDANLRERLETDVKFRDALARQMALSTKEEERVRGEGFWLRKGVNL